MLKADEQVTCAAETIRVWIDPVGKFLKNPSYAVEVERWEEHHVEVKDQVDVLRIITAAITIRINKAPLSIHFYHHDDQEIITSERKEGGAGWDDSGSVYVYHSLSESEHFYGLGQDNDGYGGSLDRRGTVRDMITGQKISKGRVTAHIPVTFFTSTGPPRYSLWNLCGQ